MSDLGEKNVPANIGGLKHIFNQYIKEIKYLKWYLIALVLVMVLSNSVFIFFDADTVSSLGDEDHFFEWLTCLFFLSGGLVFFLIFLKTRNYIFLLVACVLVFGAGEELSWGQRIFGFKTPEALKEINVQKEFNFHNIIYVNSRDFQGNWKHGLKRLLEVNFLFKVSAIFCGIILPFCVYHLKFISRITRKLHIPVPPVSIGVFFFFSWLIYFSLRTFILRGGPASVIDSAQEIFESSESFIMLIIGLYFYIENKILITGKDIKQII